MPANPTTPRDIARSIKRRVRTRDPQREMTSLRDHYHTEVQLVEEFRERITVVPGTKVSIGVETVSSEPEASGAALLELRMLDSSDSRRAIPGWGYVSKRVGDYLYCEPGTIADPAFTSVEVKVPEYGTSLEVVGHKWKSTVDTYVLGSLIVNAHSPAPLSPLPSGQFVERRADTYVEVFEIPAGATSVTFGLDLRGGTTAGLAPFAYRQFDKYHVELTPLSDSPQHSQHGPFQLIDLESDILQRKEIECKPSPEASSIEIRGVEWGSRTPVVVNPPTIVTSTAGNSEILEFLNAIGPEELLFVIDTTAPPVGHQTLSLRPNNMSLEFVKRGIRVIFLPFSTVQDQPRRVSENLLQVDRAEVGDVVSWLTSERVGFNNVYICSSYPNHRAVSMIDEFNALGWITVYECRDDMEEFNRVGYSKWYDPILERRVVEQASLVTAVSSTLAAKLQSMTIQDKTVVVTPNGVQARLIEETRSIRTVEDAAVRRESKTFGYVGHLTDAWFDWNVLLHAAEERPHYSFEIIGHGKPDWVTLPPNIAFLGPKNHDEVTEHAARWSAGLIPFKDSPLTRSVDPNKIYEYFAWGLRCVTTQMGSVETYPSTWVYSSRSDFVSCLDDSIAEPMSAAEMDTLESFLNGCSWAARAEQFVAYLFEEQ